MYRIVEAKEACNLDAEAVSRNIKEGGSWRVFYTLRKIGANTSLTASWARARVNAFNSRQ